MTSNIDTSQITDATNNVIESVVGAGQAADRGGELSEAIGGIVGCILE